MAPKLVPRPRFIKASPFYHKFRSLSNLSAVHRDARMKLAEIDANNPFPTTLIDSFNRNHDYLRISLTERCNLRCHSLSLLPVIVIDTFSGFYCMPSEGVELSPGAKILTNEEILRLAALFVKSGVTKIRLTGGEPTVRKGIADIIGLQASVLYHTLYPDIDCKPPGSLNALRPLGLKSIAMTSNGLALHRSLPRLIENGLSHLNLR